MTIFNKIPRSLFRLNKFNYNFNKLNNVKGVEFRSNIRTYSSDEYYQGGFKFGSFVFIGASTATIFIGCGAWALKNHEDRMNVLKQLKETQDSLKKNFQRTIEGVFGNKSQFNQTQGQNEIDRKMGVLKEQFSGMSTTDKIIWGIIGINTVVFLAWQIPNPRVYMFMNKHFVHHYLSKKPYTLLTSSFSHSELFHFLFNMMALKSFGQAAGALLGPEQFLALYLSGAILSSAPRHLLTGWLLKPGAVNRSLGASGAIFTIVGMVAAIRPELNASIIFLPMFPLQLDQLLAAFMCLDLIGLIRGWRTFDHMCHLTGAIYGLMYGYYGFQNVWLPTLKTVKDTKEILNGNDERLN
jgi:rhomboid-like protein